MVALLPTRLIPDFVCSTFFCFLASGEAYSPTRKQNSPIRMHAIALCAYSLEVAMRTLNTDLPLPETCRSHFLRQQFAEHWWQYEQVLGGVVKLFGESKICFLSIVKTLLNTSFFVCAKFTNRTTAPFDFFFSRQALFVDLRNSGACRGSWPITWGHWLTTDVNNSAKELRTKTNPNHKQTK